MSPTSSACPEDCALDLVLGFGPCAINTNEKDVTSPHLPFLNYSLVMNPLVTKWRISSNDGALSKLFQWWRLSETKRKPNHSYDRITYYYSYIHVRIRMHNIICIVWQMLHQVMISSISASTKIYTCVWKQQ